MNIDNGGLGFKQTLDNTDFLKKLKDSQRALIDFVSDSEKITPNRLSATNGIENIVSSVKAKTKELDKVVETSIVKASEKASDIGKNVSDSLSKVNEGASKLSKETSKQLDTIQIKSSTIAKSIAGVFTIGAATSFINQIVKVRGEFEQLEIALTTILGSKEKADKLSAEIVDFAAKTPYGLQATSEATKMLLAYGQNADTALNTMRKLGDIAAGVSIPLKDIAYLYGTTMVQGRLYTQDLNQFLGRGIPLVDELAKIFGVSKDEVKGLVEAGKVGFPEVERAIDNLTKTGSKFGGLMEAQSNSINGQIEQLKDAFDVMLNDIGKNSEGFIKAVISGGSFVVENYKEIAKILGILIASYGLYKATLIATIALERAAATAKAIGDFLTLAKSIRSAADAQALFNTIVKANPYAILATAIAGLVAVMYGLRKEYNLAEESQKNFTDANNEAAKSVAKEQGELNRLLKIAKDDNLSKENRLRAVKKLNAISPEYLGNLNLENINTQLAVKSVDAYSTALYKNAKAKAFQAKYEELINKRIEISNKTSNDYKDTIGKGFDYIFGQTKGLKDYNDVLKFVEETEGKSLKTREKILERTNILYKQFGLEEKKIELARTDAQLIDIEKELLKSQADITNITTEIDTSISKIGTDKNKTKKEVKIDQLEEYKKQLNNYKEEYERANKYLNSTDASLIVSGKNIQELLKSKGETYLEFLRNQQKQLIKSANTSELARKKLLAVNDELGNVLEGSQLDNFKKNIDAELSASEYLIDKLEIIKKAKEELTGKTDQQSLDKLKFIDEKALQNQSEIEKYLKDLSGKFDTEYNYLTKKREEYNADMLLLQQQYNKASNDAERTRIQDLISIRGAQYFEDTNNKTESTEVNRIIEENKSLAIKRLEIQKQAEDDIAKIKSQINSNTSQEELALFTSVIEQIEKKQKESLKQIDSEILKSSENWVRIFADYSNKSASEINNIVKEIEAILNNPPKNLTATEIKDLQNRLTELKKVLRMDDPFSQLGESVVRLSKKFRLANGDINFQGINEVIANTKNALNETISMAEGLGISISDSTKDAINLGAELLEAGSNIAQGIASKKPLQVVKGIVKGISSIINSGDKRKERQIRKYQEAVKELSITFNELERTASKALGGGVYNTQKQMMDNLMRQQEEYRKMIDTENKKKKKEKEKIAEWEQALIDTGNRISDIMENITQDILQTNAKDLATTLSDALVEAFAKGEDAAKSFEKVANDAIKNAVVNQLKKTFLEEQLQGALDQLYKDMGGNADGSFNWNGLTPEEQQKFRDKIKEISNNFTGALEAYSDLFGDISNSENENSLSGAIKGVSEDTANLIAGQLNAIRINIVESVGLKRDANKLLVQQLDQLSRIEFNTRSIVPLLERIYTSLTGDNTRALGF